MNYCINPDCDRRQNPNHLESCQTCGTPLSICDKYRLLRPLSPLDTERSTEIFEVAVEGERRVMKILKKSNPQLVELFDQEAFILEILDHPGIPKIDLLDGDFQVHLKTGKVLRCLVMEKIEGENLEQWLHKQGKISREVARQWLEQLLNLLDYIHARGFFHRDIKPSNIMLKPDGQLVLIDFGAAREINDTYLIAFRGQLDITSIVSRGYTAPEQIDGKATPQSDLFALGRTFVHLLTGIPPSELPTDSKTGKLIWQKRAPQVNKLFADLIDDLMAPLPRNRPQDSGTVLKSLDNLRLRSLERFITSPRFKTIAILSMSLGILLGVAGFIVNKFVISPSQAKAYSEQGRKALSDDNLTRARRNFERAIELNPRESVFYNDLGLVCKLQKDYNCARENYQKSLRFVSGSELVLICELKKEDECAKETYRELLKLASNSEKLAVTYYNLGNLYEERQEPEVALDAYEIAMQDRGIAGVYAMNNYARLKIWYHHDYKIAIQILQETLMKLESLEVPEEAKTTLQAKSYKNLGWAYLQQGDFQKAESFLKRAMDLDRGDGADIYCLIAKVLQAQGKEEKALAAWEDCRDREANNLPEVKTWQGDANQYLNVREKQE